MEAIVKIVEVDRMQTRNGNTRFTVRDADGKEYVTFRPPVGEQAERCKSSHARIEFHEEERNGFRNVYLDRVQPADEQAKGDDGARENADAAAWETAAEAAALIVGDTQVSGEELFEALKPFKDRVADDIRHGGDAEAEDKDKQPSDITPLRKPTKRSSR
jgi:hypothetical protein